jgi:hypothetical protein
VGVVVELVGEVAEKLNQQLSDSLLVKVAHGLRSAEGERSREERRFEGAYLTLLKLSLVGKVVVVSVAIAILHGVLFPSFWKRGTALCRLTRLPVRCNELKIRDKRRISVLNRWQVNRERGRERIGPVGNE